MQQAGPSQAPEIQCDCCIDLIDALARSIFASFQAPMLIAYATLLASLMIFEGVLIVAAATTTAGVACVALTTLFSGAFLFTGHQLYRTIIHIDRGFGNP